MPTVGKQISKRGDSHYSKFHKGHPRINIYTTDYLGVGGIFSGLLHLIGVYTNSGGPVRLMIRPPLSQVTVHPRMLFIYNPL